MMSLSAAPTWKSVPALAVVSTNMSSARSPEAQLKRRVAMERILTLGLFEKVRGYVRSIGQPRCLHLMVGFTRLYDPAVRPR